VPFSGGGEALAAILGGKVTAGVSGYGEFEGQVKAGKLRLIAIAAEEPVQGIDAPTLKSEGIDLAIVNWRSVVAPPGLSDEQKKALLEAVDKMVKSTQWQETLKAKGWDDAYLAGDDFAAYLKNEQVRVAEVLKSIGLVN